MKRDRPHPPLGATWDGSGVTFALYSEHAERVELCLFDAAGRRETQRIALTERTGFVWHGNVPHARPGQRYGYRVDGPHAPELGHRFNPHKVLLDPYARLVLPTGLGRCQVVDEPFDWGDDRAPRTPWSDTVIYEAHVRGLTRLHPGVAEPLRGTYAGLASAPVIEHLQRLGMTALELLPIQAFVDERRLVQHGLSNYWGYNTIGFFAPDTRYAARISPGGTLGEFKTMVKTLHAAGIEVILDVVYNHTGEGDHHGPALSFRGIDNSVYYRLDSLDRRHYLNYAGTGNCLNTSHPAVLALVLDSLRYWVEEMHVDGFRFDLAVALTRDSEVLAALQRDPVLSQVKLIAEPWDLGPHGYRLGAFPPGWSEWNDKYRDVARSWWRGDAGMVGALASRLAGSSDLFEGAGREPTASVNFVAAHDGFTLHDLLTYERKQNEANLEGNRDGADDNRSWNAAALRERQKRNLLATLLLSQGVPMLLAGDELGHTQHGNNNAYCQDNEISWLQWPDDARDLVAFVGRLTELRRQYPALRRRHYARPGEVIWLKPQGGEMTEQDWRSPYARCLGMLVPGEEDLLLLLNAHHEPVAFSLPPGEWSVVIDTAAGGPPVQAHSLVLLKASGRGRSPAGG